MFDEHDFGGVERILLNDIMGVIVAGDGNGPTRVIGNDDGYEIELCRDLLRNRQVLEDVFIVFEAWITLLHHVDFSWRHEGVIVCNPLDFLALVVFFFHILFAKKFLQSILLN